MKKTSKKIRSICFGFTLILGMFFTIPPVIPAKAEEVNSYGLNNPRIGNDDTVTWDCIYFGNYWQNDTNGDGTADKEDEKQPIKWRVLSVEGDNAFLLADQNLDYQPYKNNGKPAVFGKGSLKRQKKEIVK